MNIITRFAPSPTGLLHVGNVRTALINYLYTKANNGKFILRIDDTDISRSEKKYEDGIKRDLQWLEIIWDETFNQSSRVLRYEEVKQQLIRGGRLYPCYETVEELSIKRKSQLGRNLPPIYDRAALKLTKEEKTSFERWGIKPHWRFLLNDEPITWKDKVRGDVYFPSRSVSDPILIRADDSMTYTISSVVDDIDYKITDIVRGEDHLTNSATHIQIFKALGATYIPSFAHVCLLSSKDQEISKRIGGFDVGSLRDEGMEAMAINSFLAKLGTSDSVEFRMKMEELISEFNFSKFGKSTIYYNIEDLKRINTKMIRHMSYADINERLIEEKAEYITESFWNRVKGNINVLSDIKTWWTICNTKLQPKILDENKEFTKIVGELLPQEPWGQDIYNVWINSVKEKTGRNGHELFMPIRLALSGIDNGPELKYLLPMLGREKVVNRLNGVAY